MDLWVSNFIVRKNIRHTFGLFSFFILCLAGTSDESLLSLHEALKVQFDQVQKTYAEATAKLDSLKGHLKMPSKAPVAQSHQRQLSLKASEIQERLIKNKSLLNVVEPTLENHSLEVLLGILQRRIELDKEVLFQFTQLKKEIKLLGGKPDPSVAPLLMRFQRGCQQVGMNLRALYTCLNLNDLIIGSVKFHGKSISNSQVLISNNIHRFKNA